MQQLEHQLVRSASTTLLIAEVSITLASLVWSPMSVCHSCWLPSNVSPCSYA